MKHVLLGKTVRILRGKQAGHTAEVMCETKAHPLSSERRFGVHLNSWNSFWDRRSLIMNESALEIIDDRT